MAEAEQQAPPSLEEIADLKRLVAGIVRSQGNRFIKEILRDKRIRIGTNKDDFERNLTEAIETGELRLDDLAGWLNEVEGWGNQHAYLYNISASLRNDLTKPNIDQRVLAAGLERILDGNTISVFPEEPELTSISFTDSVLTIVWQESSTGWTRVPEKDRTEQEGLDTFEYRAWRKLERRATTRFVADMNTGIAGLFIADPVLGAEHQAAIDEAKRVIALLLDINELESSQFDISIISRNLDQQNVPTNNRPNPPVKTHKSRLGVGDSYVEFGANSPDHAYSDEQAIQDVRNSVRSDQLQVFHGTSGVFIFQPVNEGLTRSIRVQLYGKGNRVRLRALMSKDEVWAILAELSNYQ